MKIIKPTHCPVCKTELEEINFQLFCRNASCEAQNSKKVESFAKKMKIKGLGPKSIEKLKLDNVAAIYELTLEDLVDTLGKVGETIHRNIQISKRSKFATFLSALSIPLIGTTASNKLATVCNSLNDITEQKCKEAGLGGKATQILIDWIEKNSLEFSNLPIEFDPMPEKRVNLPNLGKVCITGKLSDFANRSQAKDCLEKLGYTVVNTVSKNLDYLVDEQNSSSSKTKKAKSLNISITTMQHLITAAGEK